MPENQQPPDPQPGAPQGQPGGAMPPAAPPGVGMGPSPLDELAKPRRGCAGWVIGVLVLLGVLLVGSFAVMGYIYVKKQAQQAAQMITGNVPVAPVTPPGQAPFHEVGRIITVTEAHNVVCADIDGDSVSEVIVMAGAEIITYDASGAEVEKFTHDLDIPTPPPSGSSGGWTSSIGTGDSGTMLVAMVGGEPALVAAYEFDDTLYVYRADGASVFNDTVSQAYVTCIGVADADGNGEDEILVGRGSQMGLACLNDTGTEVWKFATGSDAEFVTPADGNGDGQMELYVGSVYGAGLEVIDGRGARLATWPAAIQARGDFEMAAADLDNDGRDELVTVASQAGAGSGGWSGAFQLGLVGVDTKGTQLWNAPLAGGMPMMTGISIAAADLDADGTSEWIVPATDGTIRVVDKDGVELARQGFGDHVHALAVTPAPSGGKPTVWVSAGRHIIGLEWDKWAIPPSAVMTTP